MANIVQELNKAQLKPFLMRIWGQVGCTKLSNEDEIIYADIWGYEIMRMMMMTSFEG